MLYNFHTHTYRCSHATGTEREYIERSIEGGIKYLGFSDHAPFRFPDGHESYYRVPMDMAEEYVSSIKKLHDEYKDIIEIHVGFEMEYYPKYFDKMLNIAQSCGAEYLIMGQHFIYNEYPNGKSSFADTDRTDDLNDFVLCVSSAIKSGYFTYIAHPDVINYTGKKEIYAREMRKICVASREYNIPLEINLLGIRSGRNYPNTDFWKIAAEEKSPVTFGMDAHDSYNAYDADSIIKAEKLATKLGLNYIGMPKLIDIQKV